MNLSCDAQPISEDKFRVILTNSRGYGLICLEDIKKGSYVLEYKGEAIDYKTYLEREKCPYSDRKSLSFFITCCSEKAIIDGNVNGNIAKYINHSVDPNLVPKIKIRNACPIIMLCALEYIPRYVELFYDYGIKDKISIQDFPWLKEYRRLQDPDINNVLVLDYLPDESSEYLNRRLLFNEQYFNKRPDKFILLRNYLEAKNYNNNDLLDLNCCQDICVNGLNLANCQYNCLSIGEYILEYGGVDEFNKNYMFLLNLPFAAVAFFLIANIIDNKIMGFQNFQDLPASRAKQIVAYIYGDVAEATDERVQMFSSMILNHDSLIDILNTLNRKESLIQISHSLGDIKRYLKSELDRIEEPIALTTKKVKVFPTCRIEIKKSSIIFENNYNDDVITGIDSSSDSETDDTIT